ncbi:probable methyltransferase-like protein 25 isoform X2 [Panulirus ornatus]
MASLDNINKSLRKVSKFLAPLIPLVGCHMVDYMTANHWENYLPPQLQEDLLQLPREKLQYIPTASMQFDTHDIAYTSEGWCFSSSDLPSFIVAIREHCLPSLGITTAVEEVLNAYGSSEVNTFEMRGIMSDKKSHEVEVMSQVTARLAKGCRVDWIVDLGSGRGYLSSSLVLQYDLNVVAIDSDKSNTSSALVRKEKLQRRWGKVKQSEPRIMDGRFVKMRGKQGREGHSKQNSETQGKIEEVSSSFLNPRPKVCGRYIGITSFITDDTNLVQIVRDIIGEEKHMIKYSSTFDSDKVDKCGNDLKTENMGKNKIKEVMCDPAFKQTSETDVELEENMENLEIFENSEIHSPKLLKNSLNQNAFIPKKESHESFLPCLGPGGKNSQINDDPHLGLVGLHTCGNLAPNSLRLFLSNPNVEFLCNIGCCYQLIEEKFSKNPFNQKETKSKDNSDIISPKKKSDEHSSDSAYNSLCDAQHGFDLKSKREQFVMSSQSPVPEYDSTTVDQVLASDNLTSQEALPLNPLHPSEIPHLSYGFPLSSTLKEEKFALGRNCRMLSCQPADRLTQGKFSGIEPLYWRALLQLLLKDKLKDVSNIAHVGRIAAKCQNFPEYARMAFSKLGIAIEVTQEELEQYDHKHLDDLKKLERFYLLRASIAPVIEGIILLDRLAFLCEQENVSAHLVQLFDPVISPRCYGIIAIKNHWHCT